MSDSKVTALDVVPDPVGTYQTFLRPHQLKRGDVLMMSGPDRRPRRIVVEKATYGEVLYRGRYSPVIFVYGTEGYGTKVTLTKTSWEFLEVTRVGDAPPFYRPAMTRAERLDVY